MSIPLRYLQNQIENLSTRWYETKRDIITSTNVASILEYDVYKTKLAMFRRKVTKNQTLSNNEAVLWGLKYESIARNLCAKRYDMNIIETGLKIHSKHSFIGATPDGISMPTEKLLDMFPDASINPEEPILHEFKCLKSRHISHEIPLEYWVQMQIAMEVWDINQCLYTENIIEEYPDESYYKDDSYIADHNKGILPIGSNIYVGTQNSINNGVVKSTEPEYWCLKEHWDYLVVRDREWYKKIETDIMEFWEDVLNARNQPISDMFKPRGKKTSPTKKINYKNLNWTDAIRARQFDNFINQDTILDWLDMYGSDSQELKKDSTSPFQMQTFVFNQAFKFKQHVKDYIKKELVKKCPSINCVDIFEYPELNHLKGKVPVKINHNYSSVRLFNKTISSIESRVPVIFNGILYEPKTKYTGSADMIIREDVLHKLLVNDSDESPEIPASKTRKRYVIVLFKGSTLEVTSNGERLLYNQKQIKYQVQLTNLCQILSRITNSGKSMDKAFIISRKIKNNKDIYSEDFSKNLFCINVRNPRIFKVIKEGAEWLDILRQYGGDWNVFEIDTVQDEYKKYMRPNMKNKQDFPWNSAKKKISSHQHELTQIMNIGPVMRNKLINDFNVSKWTELTDKIIDDAKIPSAQLVWNIVQKNQDKKIPLSLGKLGFNWFTNISSLDPDIILRHERVEFYFDFETVNDMYDDFSKVPKISGHELIYMIGCVMVDNLENTCEYHSFITKDLTPESEKDMLLRFFHFVDEKSEVNREKNFRKRILHKNIPMFHWTQAEPIHLNKALKRHNIYALDEMKLIDLYSFFKEQQIVAVGSFNYGLKSVARAFYDIGIIGTTWKNGLDGAQASVGAWRAMDEMKLKDLDGLHQTRTIKSLTEYNNNDCLVMFEILNYIRNFIQSLQ
jgi:putative phage-type endonuclease